MPLESQSKLAVEPGLTPWLLTLCPELFPLSSLPSWAKKCLKVGVTCAPTGDRRSQRISEDIAPLMEMVSRHLNWIFMDLPGSSAGKESACNAGDPS